MKFPNYKLTIQFTVGEHSSNSVPKNEVAVQFTVIPSGHSYNVIILSR